MSRHLIFLGWLIAAAFVFLILSLPLAMNECQLHQTEAAARECFANATHNSRVNNWTALGFLAVAAALHIARSKWVIAALVGLAIGPFVAWAFIA